MNTQGGGELGDNFLFGARKTNRRFLLIRHYRVESVDQVMDHSASSVQSPSDWSLHSLAERRTITGNQQYKDQSLCTFLAILPGGGGYYEWMRRKVKKCMKEVCPARHFLQKIALHNCPLQTVWCIEDHTEQLNVIYSKLSFLHLLHIWYFFLFSILKSEPHKVNSLVEEIREK